MATPGGPYMTGVSHERPRSPKKSRRSSRYPSSSSESDSDDSSGSDVESTADRTPNPPSFKSVRVMDIRLPFDHSRNEVYEFLSDHRIPREIWRNFVEDIIRTWVDHDKQTISLDKRERVAQGIIRKWNIPFYRLGAEIIMCREYTTLADLQETPVNAIYLVECPIARYLPISERLTSLPEGLARIELFDNILSEMFSIVQDTFKPAKETSGNVRFNEATSGAKESNKIRKEKRKKKKSRK